MMPGNHLPASLGLTIIQIKFPLLPLPPCCISGQSLPAACPAHAGEKLFGLLQSLLFSHLKWAAHLFLLKKNQMRKTFWYSYFIISMPPEKAQIFFRKYSVTFWNLWHETARYIQISAGGSQPSPQTISAAKNTAEMHFNYKRARHKKQALL